MRALFLIGTTRRPLATAAALAFMLGLTACGGDSESSLVGATPPLGTCGGSMKCGSDGDPGPVVQANKPIVCKDYDKNDVLVNAKTITIRNNSDGQIYPVLATSTNPVNEWVQGCLRTTEPYPTELVYKLYVNDGQGIPPDSEVTITLPLYSELGPKKYITWWNGGRVLLADRNKRLRGKDDHAMATPGGVDCKGQGTTCNLSTYSSTVQFPEDAFAQLSEYTFGDSVTVPGQVERLLKPENVGYNISYVDHVYMPVAIGPRGNPYIGYSGSAQKPGDFRNTLRAFLGDLGEGWPVYNLSELRLPGGYNIFSQRGGYLVADPDVPVQPPDGQNPPVLTVMKCIDKQCTGKEQRDLQYGQAVLNMQVLWGSCVSWGGEDISQYTHGQSLTCPAGMQAKMGLIKDFFAKNFASYEQLYKDGKCEGKQRIPVFSYWETIKHIYGWVPFNEGCGAAANKLADTEIPGYDHAAVQAMYIQDLQYNYRQDAVKADPKLNFNPYVKLIHEDLKMNAYGFSVDDAVGFMSELGDGLVFTVGGVQGLENGRPFSYADGFSLMVGVPQPLAGRENMALIKRYGVCSLGQDATDPECDKNKQDVSMPAHSQIAGFRVGTVPKYPIKVRFTDMEDNVYTVVVKEKFATCVGKLADCPSNRAEIVEKGACSVFTPAGVKHAKSDMWCVSANPNQGRDHDESVIKNFLSFAVPVRYLP